MIFRDRAEAGRLLAARLASLESENPLVIALPRGGIPVAAEIARTLQCPLDILVVRKIGAPGNPEYGIGAITEDGFFRIDDQAAAEAGAGDRYLRQALLDEADEVDRRVHRYRRGRAPLEVLGRTILLVDDGLATGVSARVAAAFLRSQGAARVILAVPVAAPRTAAMLRAEVDELLCLDEPRDFHSVGQFYEDFHQVTDEEAIALLSPDPTQVEAWRLAASGKGELGESVEIVGRGGVRLPGELRLRPGARGTVVFAHGSGSSRSSPRNIAVARALNRAGLGTLLFDLLTEDEARDRERVFDIPLLASRLRLAVDWLASRGQGLSSPLGFFGASTGAGAALWAAADLGERVSAVVSRGGRPDLALQRLTEVVAPTLLIVGGLDEEVIRLNRRALGRLRLGELSIVPGATHLFEEPGKLEVVSLQAAAWFLRHFRRGGSREAA